MPVRAVIFDFNGTLSHDEPILCEIFCELFAEHGRPLSTQEYFDELAGLSDPEIVRTWLYYTILKNFLVRGTKPFRHGNDPHLLAGKVEESQILLQHEQYELVLRALRQ